MQSSKLYKKLCLLATFGTRGLLQFAVIRGTNLAPANQSRCAALYVVKVDIFVDERSHRCDACRLVRGTVELVPPSRLHSLDASVHCRPRNRLQPAQAGKEMALILRRARLKESSAASYSRNFDRRACATVRSARRFHAAPIHFICAQGHLSPQCAQPAYWSITARPG